MASSKYRRTALLILFCEGEKKSRTPPSVTPPVFTIYSTLHCTSPGTHYPSYISHTSRHFAYDVHCLMRLSTISRFASASRLYCTAIILCCSSDRVKGGGCITFNGRRQQSTQLCAPFKRNHKWKVRRWYTGFRVEEASTPYALPRKRL